MLLADYQMLGEPGPGPDRDPPEDPDQGIRFFGEYTEKRILFTVE